MRRVPRGDHTAAMSAGAYVSTAPARPRLTPSAWWYVAAAAIALAGMVAGVWMMVEGVGRVLEAVEDFDRTDVPGTLTVTIEDPGGYSIYHEFPGASDSGSRSPVPEPDLSITNPDGDDVQLRPYTSLVTYAWGTIEGRGLYTFHADEPGTYELTADGDEGTRIAVGRGMGDIGQEALVGLFSGVAGGLLVGGLSIAVASILAVGVGVARSRNRRSSLPRPPHAGSAPPPIWPPYKPIPWPPAPSPPTWPSTGTPRDAPPQSSPQPVPPARPPTAGPRDAPPQSSPPPVPPARSPTGTPRDALPQSSPPPVPPARPPTAGPRDALPQASPPPVPPAPPPAAGPQDALPQASPPPVPPAPPPAAGPQDAPPQSSPPPVPPAPPPTAGPQDAQPKAAPTVVPTARPQEAPRQSVAQSAPPERSPTGEPTRGDSPSPVLAPTGRSTAAGSSAGSGPAEPHVPGEAPTLPGSPPAGSLAACPPASGRPDTPLPWSRPAETVSRPEDPPSLRSPADWSRSDVEIPWDPDSL